MLTSIEKSCLKKLLKDNLTSKLLGNTPFNPYNCEIAFNNLTNKQKISFLLNLEKYYFEKQYSDLNNSNLISFLNDDYKPNSSFVIFNSHCGTQLRKNILDLSTVHLKFRVALEFPRKMISAKPKLSLSFLSFISAIYNFYENENLF